MLSNFVGGNDISNEGMKILSTTLRSLPNLIDLNLSYNKFTDDGFIEFIREDKYPEQLKVLNIQFNLLENKSAYHFGSLLNSKHRKNNLEALFLGGKVGKKGWGNQYFTILMVALLPQAIIIDNSLRNKGRPLSSKNGKKFLFGKAKEVSGKTYVSIKRGMGSSKGTIDTALEDIKMNDKNIRPFANKKLKTIFIPDFNITHNGIMSIITLILSSKTITSLNISKNAIPETYAKDLLVNSVRISNSVTEIFARQCGLHDSHYRKLEHNVKIFSDKNLDAQSTVNKTAVNGSFDSLGSGSNRGSNSIVQGIYLGSNHSLDSYQLSEIHGFSNNHSSDSLSWSEKVQLAYYAGKALFEGQTVYHNIMTELTTQWKAKKPAKFVGEMYENKLYTAGSNPKRNNILQTILAELDVPIDLLVYDMHKYLSPFDSLLNYIELLKEAKETITGSVPLKIRFDGGIRNYCSDLEIQKLQVYSDSVSNSLQGILLELLRYETRYNRDRNMYYNIIKSFCEKSIYQNSSNGKSAGRFTLPTRFKPKPKPINDNAILMVIEDYHALLLELISSYEKAIGCTYQLKLLHNYLFIDDAIYSFENYNHSQVPYYCTLGYAALFVHYFYVEFPVEKKKSFDEGHLDRIREQLRSAHGEGQLGKFWIVV